MPQEDCSNTFKESLVGLHEFYLNEGLSSEDLQNALSHRRKHFSNNREYIRYATFFGLSLIPLLIGLVCFKYNLIGIALGFRCAIPNNYFIWEATRPISDCSFCSNLTEPIVLPNVTKEEFQPYAYSSQPIIVKGAFLHWPAMKKFSWQFFKELYEDTKDSYKSVDDQCQFLHFKSDFTSIKDVFSMKSARVNNMAGEDSWYVGWGNCHPHVLEEMRKYYPKPHFLPEDAEIPYKEYIFMGYDDGATMHQDFINRLMWQAQLQGSKIWKLVPPPECQSVCTPMTFEIQPGDGLLVDTRIWYHATAIPNGQFSLSIQSEYG